MVKVKMTQDLASIFRQRFQARMTDLGVEGPWVADKLGVDPSVVNRWIKGTTAPNMANLGRVGAVLSIDPSEMIRPMSPVPVETVSRAPFRRFVRVLSPLKDNQLWEVVEFALVTAKGMGFIHEIPPRNNEQEPGQ